MTWLRTLMLLALIAWIGGIIFFAFVVAPAAFRVLPSQQMAASMVGPSLTALHWIGIVSGLVFLCCSVALSYSSNYRLRLLSPANLLVLAMLALTIISQFVITPAMRRSRAQLTLSTHVLTADEIRRTQAGMQEHFQRLHNWSERLEGGVLLLGAGLVVLTARRFS